MRLSFNELRRINVIRCEEGFGHKLDAWSLSDWTVAAAGEMGELCNVVKKLNRNRDGIANTKGETEQQLRQAICDEAADTVIYLDLLLAWLGYDLSDCIVKKFNEDSELRGIPHRLGDYHEPR